MQREGRIASMGSDARADHVAFFVDPTPHEAFSQARFQGLGRVRGIQRKKFDSPGTRHRFAVTAKLVVVAAMRTLTASTSLIFLTRRPYSF